MTRRGRIEQHLRQIRLTPGEPLRGAPDFTILFMLDEAAVFTQEGCNKSWPAARYDLILLAHEESLVLRGSAPVSCLLLSFSRQ